MRPVRRRPAGVAGVALLLAVGIAARRADAVGVLDVPYLAQPEALCGGAAAAMVLRYWGDAGARPEDFAGLLVRDAGGIPTTALAAAIRARGWQAFEISGLLETLRLHLAKGRPIIALLQVRRGRFHYVVVVGEAASGILLHDPARASYRVMDTQKFVRAWAAADHWGLLVLPPSGQEEASAGRSEEIEPTVPVDQAVPRPSTGSGRTGEVPGPSTGLRQAQADRSGPTVAVPCQSLVADGVALANAGELAAAAKRLQAANALCPDAAGPVRELAGLRAREKNWPAAEDLAQLAVTNDPGDTLAWQILATSRFVQEKTFAALEAWNAVAEPRVDLLRIDGLERTRYQVIASHLDLQPGALLTPSSLERARRRLAEVPVVAQSRLDYRPTGSGRAQVEAAVVEQPLLPGGALGFAAFGAHALTEREVRFDVRAPTGNGELWSASWRWWENRPKVELSLATPAPFGPRSIWRLSGAIERETYATQAGPLEEERRGMELGASDWASSWLRWEGTLGFDRWQSHGETVSLGGAVEGRWARDRLTLRVEAAQWFSLDGLAPFATGGIELRWGSAATSGAFVPRATAGFLAAGDAAPWMVWPGAGEGHAREPLLRAHPLLQDGILQGEAFGRELGHASLEVVRTLWGLGPVRVGAAAFVDTAHAWGRLDSQPEAGTQVDAGAGLRLVGLSGNSSLRIDVAWGLVDGASAMSIGWSPF